MVIIDNTCIYEYLEMLLLSRCSTSTYCVTHSVPSQYLVWRSCLQEKFLRLFLFSTLVFYPLFLSSAHSLDGLSFTPPPSALLSYTLFSKSSDVPCFICSVSRKYFPYNWCFICTKIPISVSYIFHPTLTHHKHPLCNSFSSHIFMIAILHSLYPCHKYM